MHQKEGAIIEEKLCLPGMAIEHNWKSTLSINDLLVVKRLLTFFLNDYLKCTCHFWSAITHLFRF